MEMNWSFWSAIVGALVGGTVSGFFSWLAASSSTQNAHKNLLDKATQDENRLIIGLLQTLHDDTEALVESYEKTMGPMVEALRDGEPLLQIYPLEEDYYTVYNSNTNLLGRIPDSALRKEIIKTYNMSKGMVDNFRLNNHLVQKYEDERKIYQQTQRPTHMHQMVTARNACVEYARSIKQYHLQAKSQTYNLLEALKQNIAARKIAW